MNHYITVLLLIVSLTAAMAQINPAVTSKHDSTVTAKTDLGDRIVATREMLVDVTHPKWQSGKGALLVLFDSASGYYQWRIAPRPKTQQLPEMANIGKGDLDKFYVAPDRLVYFVLGYPYLYARESRQKANNLDEAEAKALSDAKGRLDSLLAFKQDDQVATNLVKLLPSQFATPPGQPNRGPLKLVDVVHKGSTWEITVQGQWQEKITLDDKYQVTATSRIN
jgi:hypothetical protein